MKAYLITMFIIWIIKAVTPVPDFSKKSDEYMIGVAFGRFIIGLLFAIWTGCLLFK